MSQTAIKPSIFLVDDNDAHRTLIKRALTKAGFGLPVLEARSVSDARSLLFNLQKAPDVAIAVLDLNLGDGRGTDILRELRKSEHYAKVPVLILSTSSLISDKEESYSCGADLFLTKNADPSRFLDQIAQGVATLLAPN